MRFFAVLFLAAFCCMSSPAFVAAQEGDYDEYEPTFDMGDQMIIISGGLFAPLFYQSLAGDINSTRLTVGGVGSLQWSTYLNNNMSVGAEGGGMFAFTPNGRNLFMVPVTARFSYVLRKHPFDFPLSLAAGLNFVRLDSTFRVMPIIKPGISGFWSYNSSWSFGLNLVYWWVPDIYMGPSPPREQSRLGNFLEVSLSARYYF
ncbi:MAG: hypothetical protein LBC67_07080 [Spirochaetales bacterium]|nr:hypothetical protein [Spirochaetales bacterium]